MKSVGQSTENMTTLSSGSLPGSSSATGIFQPWLKARGFIVLSSKTHYIGRRAFKEQFISHEFHIGFGVFKKCLITLAQVV